MIDLALYEFDNQYADRYGSKVCGVDEAGRGPLAGPVVVAAVVLPRDCYIEDLNDSKKLSETQREAIYEEIVRRARMYQIITIDSTTIDRMNILAATLYGMRYAIDYLDLLPDISLIDGNNAPDTDWNIETVVKGDSLSASIAAASILAKVTRDRYMTKISSQYEGFSFETHKGYATKAHYDEISKYGITPIHRKSFLTKPNRYFDPSILTKE
ncbi:MAG: ribonuclease HII, partial [Oscillospiraceae bacterium]|nr:ribonuclease HII [Oscillospiraceae bacterium]